MQYENLSIGQMERNRSISRKSIGKWLQNSPQIIANSASDSPRLPGGDRKPFFSEVENELLRYFKEQRGNKLSVNQELKKTRYQVYRRIG